MKAKIETTWQEVCELQKEHGGWRVAPLSLKTLSADFKSSCWWYSHDWTSSEIMEDTKKAIIINPS